MGTSSGSTVCAAAREGRGRSAAAATRVARAEPAAATRRPARVTRTGRSGTSRPGAMESHPGAGGNLLALRGGLDLRESEAEGPVENPPGFGEAQGVARRSQHDRRDVRALGRLHLRGQAVARFTDEAGLAARDLPLAAKEAVRVDELVELPVAHERVVGLLHDR